jgi:hypothetical protein
MTWPEPLTAGTTAEDEHHFAAYVFAGDRRIVATVRCAVNKRARCGSFGAIRILDDRGGPRQKLAAMRLLVRASLAHADQLGVTRVTTLHIPEAMRDFAERITNHRAEQRGEGEYRMTGELADIRSSVLDNTDDQGEERGPRGR